MITRGSLAGTGSMLRLFLRRDRWFLPVIIIFPALVQLVFVAAFTATAPTDARPRRIRRDQRAQRRLHRHLRRAAGLEPR